MVEKRTIVLIALMTIVWASITSGFATYYYLEQARYREKFSEEKQLLIELTENYDASRTKQDLLSKDYNDLLREYYQFFGDDLTLFVEKYDALLSNLGNNYTFPLNMFPKLNETYNNLVNRIHNTQEITREEFDSLLNDFYRLLTELATKELENFLDKISVMQVDFCVDYGNGTIDWYNVSIPHGMTLFDLTQNVTKVEYVYYSWMEPGHTLVNSINNVAPSGGKYWFWYYWDETDNKWVSGQVGCDAWVLKNNGAYKWEYTMWSP